MDENFLLRRQLRLRRLPSRLAGKGSLIKESTRRPRAGGGWGRRTAFLEAGTFYLPLPNTLAYRKNVWSVSALIAVAYTRPPTGPQRSISGSQDPFEHPS